MGGNLISTDKSTILTWVSSEVVGGGGRGGCKNLILKTKCLGECVRRLVGNPEAHLLRSSQSSGPQLLKSSKLPNPSKKGESEPRDQETGITTCK